MEKNIRLKRNWNFKVPNNNRSFMNHFKVNVTNKTNNVDLENYVPNGEWELLDTKLVRMISYFPCCPEPYPYVSVTLK